MSEEIKTEEVVIETKADDLAEVKTAIDSVASENAELKAAAEAADIVAKELQADLAVKAEKLAEFEAKANAPAVLTSKNKAPEMNLVKTFMQEGVEALRSKAANLQISVDAQGGFSLPEELRQEIIKLEYEQSPMRQSVNVRSASTTDVKQLVSVGGAASGWVGETDTRPNTGSPELAQRIAAFGELYANPTAYVHMLEDSFFNAESWLAENVAREFGEQEGQKWLTGAGTGTDPKGMLTGLDLTQASGDVSATNSKIKRDILGAYEVIVSGTDGALGADASGIIDFLRGVTHKLQKGYRGSAKFMMNEATLDSLVGLKNADGEYFLQRDITKASANSLFGYPVVTNEDMDGIPGTTDTGAACILFGDFNRAYQIIDRVGVSTIRDAITVKGSVQFYTRKRTGSMVLDASALKVVSVAKS